MAYLCHRSHQHPAPHLLLQPCNMHCHRQYHGYCLLRCRWCRHHCRYRCRHLCHRHLHRATASGWVPAVISRPQQQRALTSTWGGRGEPGWPLCSLPWRLQCCYASRSLRCSRHYLYSSCGAASCASSTEYAVGCSQVIRHALTNERRGARRGLEWTTDAVDKVPSKVGEAYTSSLHDHHLVLLSSLHHTVNNRSRVAFAYLNDAQLLCPPYGSCRLSDRKGWL